MHRLHDLDLLPFEQPEGWVGDDLVGCGEPGRHRRLEAEIAADRDDLQVDVLPVVQRPNANLMPTTFSQPAVRSLRNRLPIARSTKCPLNPSCVGRSPPSGRAT
jgi:hypothetical protein